MAQEEKMAYEAGVNISPRQTMPIFPAMVDPEQASGPDAETEEHLDLEDVDEGEGQTDQEEAVSRIGPEVS